MENEEHFPYVVIFKGMFTNFEPNWSKNKLFSKRQNTKHFSVEKIKIQDFFIPDQRHLL